MSALDDLSAALDEVQEAEERSQIQEAGQQNEKPWKLKKKQKELALEQEQTRMQGIDQLELALLNALSAGDHCNCCIRFIAPIICTGVPDANDDIKAAQAYVDANQSTSSGEVVVAVELGIGKQKMQGLVMAPSADQSNLVVASVTPESKVAAV
jgi:hypothetical protein